MSTTHAITTPGAIGDALRERGCYVVCCAREIIVARGAAKLASFVETVLIVILRLICTLIHV